MSKSTCMRDGCDRGVRARGLCGTHYNEAASHVARQKTTWVELEELGLVKAPSQRGRKGSGLTTLLAKAKADQLEPQ